MRARLIMAINWRGYCMVFVSFSTEYHTRSVSGPDTFSEAHIKESKEEDQEHFFEARTRSRSDKSSESGSLSAVTKKLVETTDALK